MFHFGKKVGAKATEIKTIVGPVSMYCGSLYIQDFIIICTLDQSTCQGKPVNNLMLIYPNVKYLTDFMNSNSTSTH